MINFQTLSNLDFFNTPALVPPATGSNGPKPGRRFEALLLHSDGRQLEPPVVLALSNADGLAWDRAFVVTLPRMPPAADRGLPLARLCAFTRRSRRAPSGA